MCYDRQSYLRRVERTNERREMLIESLGGKCVSCGSTYNLEFDHIYGRDWVIRDVCRWKRMSLYESEAAQGLIRLLCRSCNGSLRPGLPHTREFNEALNVIPF